MTRPPTESDALDRLEQHVRRIILSRQHPVTGLLPASTAVNAHGDYTDAWVRDNVYSVLCLWGLALAYAKRDSNDGPGVELEQATVKLMRGLLVAMMKQAPKVEAFKRTQDPLDALHAKYDTRTGDVVVADHAWGHLQLDATALFLLMLAQMTSSGLQIVFTLDEVNFVQNLVFYLGRAYRTPDFGIWERGDKTNHGRPELNASSVAMAKAALEALSDFNLFGVRGSQASVIHVLPDDIARARITLEALLPRESISKEVDAALLAAVGFPAFAVEDGALARATREAVVGKLGGRYGLKRFLRDGHQTVLEDTNRLHYQPDELGRFEHLESEWPLFVCYLALDALFEGDREAAERYRATLDRLALEVDGERLVPELYFVPAERVEAERERPGSQERLPNANVPLVWAQSLYVLTRLLLAGHLEPDDLDPLGRHRRRHAGRPVVQLALLAEDEELQAELAERGVVTQTPSELGTVELWHATDLASAYYQIGRNDKLGLTGRPVKRMHSLGTSRVYRLRGGRVVCLPSFFDQQAFYLSLDPRFLMARLRSEVAYLHRHWSLPGRPTMTLLFTHALFDKGRDALFETMDELRGGTLGGVPIKLGSLRELMRMANEERVDNLHDFRDEPKPLVSGTSAHLARGHRDQHPLRPDQEVAIELAEDPAGLRGRLTRSENPFEQVELLGALARLEGLDGPAANGTSVRELIEEVYAHASDLGLWGVVRRAAGLLEKVDVALSDSVNDLLTSQKLIVIGKAYTEASTLDRPLPQDELLAKIRHFCREDIRDRVLTQEVLIYLSSLIRAEPALFRGMLTVRVGHMILLLASDLAAGEGVTQDEGYDRLMQLPPFEIQQRLRQVLLAYSSAGSLLRRQEALQAANARGLVLPGVDGEALPPPPGGWWRWRQREGAVSRVSDGFHQQVWRLLDRCRGLVIGDKLERRNRLESAVLLSLSTPGEKSFALRVEHLLNKIASPEYRQVTIEALAALVRIAEANPELRIDGYVVLDVLVGHAVREAWLRRHPETEAGYDEAKAAAWASFYELSPPETSEAIVVAFRTLIGEPPERELAPAPGG